MDLGRTGISLSGRTGTRAKVNQGERTRTQYDSAHTIQCIIVYIALNTCLMGSYNNEKQLEQSRCQ